MFRLPFMVTGLGAAAAIVAATNGAFGDVGNALPLADIAGNKGPLIIHITHDPAAQGAGEVLKQTRCLLEWQATKPGQYGKQCRSSILPR